MTVCVVGGGVSGLALVHALEKRGVDVVAYEAAAEPGGLVKSRRVDGHVLELGPQRLRLTPTIATLIDELELGDELVYGDDDQPLYVYHDGRLGVAPLSVREAITTDLLSLRGKLRILGEPLTGPPRAGETVAEFLTRKFGTQAARRYMGPLYSGLYGTDPDDMYVEHSLGRALANAGVDGSILLWATKAVLSGRDPPPICTFGDGLKRLPEALADTHADRVHFETPVREIRRTDDRASYEVVTDDGTTVADDVVLTTPAGTSAALLESAEPELAATLSRFAYNPIAMVYLESDFTEPGIGCLVPDSEPLPISGATWNASFLGRDRLFTCYVDAGSYPDVCEASDADLEAAAAGAFEQITGASATPIYVHRWDPGMPAYDRSWTALDDLEVPDGLHLCTNFTERAGLPGRIRHATRLADELSAG